MIFESLWPLLFLTAVPVIIILYLLKPKGTDYLISSNLLWKKLLKNEKSRTFFEKFVHNILMYLQLLIIVLLAIALMSPYISSYGQGGGRKILLIDTSASMQHANGAKTRFDEAVAQACDYIRTSQNTRFSIVATDASGAKLLAVDASDTDSLLQILRGLECSDCGGELLQTQELIDTLAGDTADTAADLIVYTDGQGAQGFGELHTTAGKELHVIGSAASNVANEYTVFTKRNDGFYDVMVSVANYSDAEVSFDVSLYDDDNYRNKLLALKQVQLAPSETAYCLFEQVDWQGKTLESRIDRISFSGNQAGEGDSLAGDNISQVVKSGENRINGMLIGSGNTFIEKAYLAVTGESIAKADTDAAVNEESDELKRTPFSERKYNVVIYDAGQTPKSADTNCLIFGNAGSETAKTLKNVALDMTDCDLTSGLSGFTIGVNTAYSFELPENAKSFLEYKGECVGYYRETDGRREIVVGFDIRESDFPLRAEFPVFLANAMIYLADTSWLASNTYYAGEEIALQPWAELDRSQFDLRPSKAGLYQLGNEDYQEKYVVRFQTALESDGRVTTDSIINTNTLQRQKIKQNIRNLFIISALVLLVIEWIVYVRQMRCHGIFYPVMRGIVFLCLLLTLFGLKVRFVSNKTATVFVVDLSNSNESHLEDAEKYMREAVSKMPANNVYGIVTFGKNAQVEQFLTSERHYNGLMTLPEKSATNFEDALSRALTLLSGNYNKRIVVLTDGKETRGDIRNMAQALTASRAEFLTLLYENVQAQDAYIDNIIIPSYLHPGDKYSITVLVESNYDTDAVITLYNEGMENKDINKIAANSVHLNKGSNRFVFQAQVSDDTDNNTMENLQVKVQAQGDICQENDVFNAYSVVEAPPKVLVISGDDTGVSAFTSVLDAAGCDYSVVSAKSAPNRIEDMIQYKCIILINTYIDVLPYGFLDNLETYVKDYGRGFVCCGGEESYALGGYNNTVLETVLPVDMRLRSMNESPTMAMVMVIDRSGSMTISDNDVGISSLDVAIRAATVAVDSLQDSDYVGILTFDDKYKWQVELCQAGDKEEINNKIKKIDEGGGTTIKPALKEAAMALSKSSVSIKHVVLLTDGMGETTDFRDIVNAFNSNQITLSTVAVGTGSDTELLSRIANDCGGRYYYSDTASDIPRIFAQEVFLGGDSYIQNGTFPLAVRNGHELTNGLFAEGWPDIYGYVAATPKTASSSVIVSGDKGNPILTTWQYGLGRTVAWNSDVTGEWTGGFAGKDDYVQLWKRIVDYSAGNTDIGEDSVNVVTAGDRTIVEYHADDYSSATEIFAIIINTKGDATEQKLRATAPGKYTAEFDTPQSGLYHFNIQRREDGQLANNMTTAAAVQFSDEYKYDVDTTAYLSFAEQYGRIITEKDFVWKHPSKKAKDGYPLTGWLLALSILLFTADVAMRRLQYQPKWNFKGRKQKIQEESSAIHTDNIEKNAEQTMDQTTEQAMESTFMKKQTKRSAKPKKSKQTGQTLDTSQLLKKKDDRNI